MNRARAGAARSLRASCISTSEAARMSPSTLSGSSRAAVPSWPCAPAQAVAVGIADHRGEGGYGADHGRRREADHPVAAHRPAPPRASLPGRHRWKRCAGGSPSRPGSSRGSRGYDWRCRAVRAARRVGRPAPGPRCRRTTRRGHTALRSFLVATATARACPALPACCGGSGPRPGSRQETCLQVRLSARPWRYVAETVRLLAARVP
jgi:hypothetical protein